MELVSYTTDRLTVCHWGDALGHPQARVRLEQDLLPILTPAVLAHLPPSLQTEQTPGAINKWVNNRSQESDVYTISKTTSGQLIGLLILADPQNPHQIHLGYLLAESAWGQGYASEILQRLVAQFTHRPVQLMGGVVRDNPASARVLEKAGFHQVAEQSDDNTIFYVWTSAINRT